jgi:hypothetical protein
MCEKELSKLDFDGDVKSASSGFQVSGALSGRGACLPHEVNCPLGSYVSHLPLT